MQPLPKIVSARLQSAPRSDHPDADVLTAFAEQSLAHSERALVMEHLSLCGGCREVLALALPEMEEAAAVAVVRRPWVSPASLGLPSLSLPALRWGAVAAALVVLVSIGVIRYRQNAPQNTVASLKLDSAAKTGAQSKAATPAPEAQSETTLAASGPGKPSPVIPPSTRGDSLGPAPTSGALKSQSVDSEKAHSALPIPAQTEAVEIATAAPALTRQPSKESQQSEQQLESQTDQISAGPSSSAPSEERALVARAKAPVTAQSGAAPAAGSGAMARVSFTPRWMITSSGGLQRSYDQGKTWQDVNVPVASQPAATAQFEVVAPSVQTRLQSKNQKNSPASPVFRAIAVSGAEVWAGAAGGVLYHSVDSGDHWFSATPSYNGILLTGDIVSVQFADSLHGKLATSTSETWTTGDGGQHWSKQ